MLAGDELAPTTLGTGWNTYTLMAAPGDLGGSAADDVVGRDRDGVLWLHRGEGQTLLPRTKVGGGWQVYNKITAGSDLNGDGRGDLLATDTSGVLWFYAATGDADAPFKPRKKVGGGWGVYNLLTAPGNIAGATGGDLLARDTSGTLWMYLGKGDGTFTARRRVGGGWQQFSHLTAFGDKNGDGRRDLHAIGPSGSRSYHATGSVDRPFGTPETLHLRSDTTFKTVF
ncbi:FG-GAP repeat domain-containing protein [Streptomyces zhihengii]